jgi:hypothetical protein
MQMHDTEGEEVYGEEGGGCLLVVVAKIFRRINISPLHFLLKLRAVRVTVLPVYLHKQVSAPPLYPK